jgi:uncharacterized protein
MPRMANAIEYPPGTPSFVDLSSPDPDSSAAFYGALFGWQAAEVGDPEETGGYQMLLAGDDVVGGLGPLQPNTGPPRWTTYITVSDADEAARKIEGAGGNVLAPPFDVFDAGRMAVVTDGADGAAFAVWQPGTSRGATRVNGVGAMSWNELDTRDPEGAQRFYGEVFGWEADPIEQDGKPVYWTWKLEGRTIGGMLPMGETFPPEVPANWVAYFGFEDLDAAGKQVEQLGGQVMMPPQEVPSGRFGVFRDPQGAVFAGVEGSYDPPPGG